VATVVGTRIVLLKTVPFPPAGVCLRPRPVPRAGTERATCGDAAASYTVWKVRTTVGGRLPGGSSGRSRGYRQVMARGRFPYPKGFSGLREDRGFLVAAADAGPAVHAEGPDAHEYAGGGVLEGKVMGLE
jgi:hypothetical protein